MTECIKPYWVNHSLCYNETINDIRICCQEFVTNTICYWKYSQCVSNDYMIEPIYYFKEPINIDTIGYNIMLYTNISNVSDCARYCLQLYRCFSFDYDIIVRKCYINSHSLSIDNITYMIGNHSVKYYERITVDDMIEPQHLQPSTSQQTSIPSTSQQTSMPSTSQKTSITKTKQQATTQ